MSHDLDPPGEELARRLLGSVPYRDRLPAGRLRPPVGMLRGDVRGLHEVHLLLAPDLQSLPAINLGKLADWIGRVVGDAELADRLRALTRAAKHYVEACLAAYELIGHRLAQARQVAGGEVR